MSTFEKITLTLFYNGVRIGSIADAFCSDNTWYGIYTLEDNPNAIGRRVSAHINFCVEWNERLNEGGNAEAKEFNQFQDLTASGLWTVNRDSGESKVIEDAPIFFKAMRSRGATRVNLPSAVHIPPSKQPHPITTPTLFYNPLPQRYFPL